MRVSLVAALPILAAAICSSAAAQERQWIAQKSPLGVEMMYGLPESDDILFAVRCDADARQIFVGFAHEPIGAGPGDTITLGLMSENGEIGLPAIVAYIDAMDITLIETTEVAGAELKPILSGGGTLFVMVEDGSEEIQLDGTAGDFADLFAACGL